MSLTVRFCTKLGLAARQGLQLTAKLANSTGRQRLHESAGARFPAQSSSSEPMKGTEEATLRSQHVSHQLAQTADIKAKKEEEGKGHEFDVFEQPHMRLMPHLTKELQSKGKVYNPKLDASATKNSNQ